MTSQVKPDCGIAWLMVFVSFMAHLVADGIAYSFGILFVEFVDYFDSSHSNVAWISSVMLVMIYAPALFTAALTAYFGFRPVAFAAAVISMIGLALCFLATRLEHLFLLLGVVVGLGFGMLMFSVFVNMQHWFDKRTSLATGISTAGSGIGMFTMAPLIQWMLSSVGWRGTLLIMSGLMGQVVVLTLLMREAPDFIEECTPEESNDGITRQDSQGVKAALQKKDSSVIENGENLGDQEQEVALLDNKNESALEENKTLLDRKSAKNGGNPFLSQQTLNKEKGTSALILGGSSVALDISPMYRSKTKVAGKKGQANGDLTDSDLSVEGKKTSFRYICCNMLKHAFDFSVLKILSVDQLLLADIVTQIGFIIPFIFIPDRAISLGISPRSASFLISLIAASNTAARVVFGIAADSMKNYRAQVVGSVTFVGGIVNVASIYMGDFTTLAVYAVLHGVLLGTIVLMHPVILRDIVGIHLLSKAYSIRQVANAVASLPSGPFIGWIYDMTKSYDIPFIITGGCFLVGGLLTFSIPYTRKCCRQTVN